MFDYLECLIILLRVSKVIEQICFDNSQIESEIEMNKFYLGLLLRELFNNDHIV